MKKIFLLFTAAALSAGMVFAQDINQATDLYNNGAMELEMGNTAAALENMQNALAMAETLGDEGTDLVNNCKTYIPKLMISIAKGLIKDGNYDAASEYLTRTVETANLYEDAETAEDATELIPQVYLSKGNDLLQAKNFPEAEAAYKKVLELDATNGMAYFRLGQVLASQNKVAEAEAAYVQAAANGQEKNAKTQLSKMFAKLANNANKAKKYQEVIEFAAKSNQYLENATAYRLAGSAYQMSGKNEESIASLVKYLELNPNAKDGGDVKYTIAALYQLGGNKAKAKEYFQMVSTDPKWGVQAQEQLKTL